MRSGSNSIRISVVLAVVLAITSLAALAAFIWAYMEKDYYQYETSLIVDEAVSEAKDEQRAFDEANFFEEAKLPNRVFTGPSDFGSVSFSYPKTWAAYNDKNDNSNYSVYFYPAIVPTVKSDTAYALRVSVTSQSYDTVVKSYNNQVIKGELTATTINTAIDGHQGTRVDGQISKSLNGSAAIFKVRDKTLVIQVDSPDYLNDFNVVLDSLTFSP